MMGNKLVIVPFDLELSKEITNGEVEGRIITRVGNSVRILCYDVIGNKYNICGLVHYGKSEEPAVFTEKGLFYENQTDDLDLMIEIPEYLSFKDGDEKKKGYEFKPFDRVLVRQSETCKWEASFFSNITDEVHKYRCCGMNYMFCIPYDEQTAHLLGTKDNWEE